MYFTTHLLAGAAAGSLVVGLAPTEGAGLALIAGLVSHIALDCLPHHDYHKARYGFLDAGIGLLLVVYFGGVIQAQTALLGALGGVLPDLEVVTRHCLAGRGAVTSQALFPTHSGLLRHRALRLPWGLLIQLVVAGVCLLTIRPVLG